MPNVEYWFSTPLWFSNINIDNKKVEEYCKELSKKNKGRVLSNVGGWQSHDLFLNEKTDKRIKPLFFNILNELKELIQQIELQDSYRLNESSLQFWININGQENYNQLHNHPRSFISGVYYVKVPKNSGNIIFHHPNTLMKFWYQQYTKGITHDSHPLVFVTPEEGKLVLFPSWLEHVVESNKTGKKRISIAFNASLQEL
jgi:uncharacterized protein (TIGR02466 family)